MNKRTIGAIFLLILIAMLSVLQACAEAKPSFEVLSLDITPPKITTGEKATVEVQIRNSNAKMDMYNVPLMVNGVADDRKSVMLTPGATELITFVLTRSQAGTYRISVGNKESTLVVEKSLPPDFRLSNLESNPTEVSTGDNVIVTAKIANVGGTQGSYTAELKVDGVTNQTEKIIIPAGTDYMLVFKVSRDLPGTYTVALGDLTCQFVVKEPPRPVVINPPCPPSDAGSCGPGG
ncbi:MAG: hypothetical protein NTW48_07100 [Chloroflexi bacterium]|nr:hypothetical protein [Chloroflexota bacterium]